MMTGKKRVGQGWAGRKRRERVLSALLAGETDLESLAGRLEMRLGELALVCGEAETAAALAGLRRLADVQTQLLVSRYRLTAAAKLVALANQDEDGELARKACWDLLRAEVVKVELELGELGGGSGKSGPSGAPPEKPSSDPACDEGVGEVDVAGVLEALREV